MFDKLIKFVSSKNPKELLIIVVVIILGIWIIKTFVFPKFGDIIKKITPPKPHDGSDANLLPEREAFIRTLANDMWEGVTCYWCSGAGLITAIDQALALNDSELIFLNKIYGEKGDNTMYYDIDWEFLPSVESDELLMARLEELNISMK